MNKTLIIAGISLACFSLTSQAHPGGGGGSGSGSGHFSGSSSSHISSEGLQNTNGPDSIDRDTRLDRAEDRMNQEGLAHEQATDNIDHKGKNQHQQQDTDNNKTE